MNTICIKSDDVIFLDENNNIIESTVPGYSANLVERLEGNDIIRFYEFVPCEYKTLIPKMLSSYVKKINQDKGIPNHIVRINHDLHHIKIKIRKIISKYNTTTKELPKDGIVSIDLNGIPTVTFGKNELIGTISIGPSKETSKLNIFERTYYSYVVDFNSFKLFDINNNFIRNIDGNDVTKCEYRDEYQYSYSYSKPEKTMYMDANKNYLSYLPNDLDSCIVEFDIFV